MECNERVMQEAASTVALAETLLVVDDDDEIRELLCDYLAQAGYRVLAAADGTQMWQQLESHAVDMLVLDLMLPGEDGLSLCRRLQGMATLGIIILSAKGSAFDRIIGLEVGADDYLAKPFEPRELLARIKAVLRRGGRSDRAVAPAAGAPQQFAGYSFDHAKRLLGCPGGHQLTLARSDYRVLRDLLAAREQVLSRDQLTRSAFGREHLPDDRSIDMCISRLRQRFKADGGAVQILTIRNEGYLLSIGGTDALT
jgi:DNA-binding response OmpR family regulator